MKYSISNGYLASYYGTERYFYTDGQDKPVEKGFVYDYFEGKIIPEDDIEPGYNIETIQQSVPAYLWEI